jgi:OmpA-OmpF porin, OOP family
LECTSFTPRGHRGDVGGNLGSSHFKGDAVGGAETDRSDTGLKLYGGYAFTPNLGVEAGWANLGKFKSSAGEVKGDGLFVDAVGTLPLGYNFSGLARVGVFNGKLDSSLAGSERSTNLKVGAGLQYDIDKNLGVRAEWERYRFKAFGSASNTDFHSVGVNYRF